MLTVHQTVKLAVDECRRGHGPKLVEAKTYRLVPHTSSDDDRRYREFWENPEGRRVHIIGKDILRFHAVYWPAFLLSAGIPLPTTVWAHGWWLRDEKKVSKSVGNIVQPDALVVEFGPDALRYFLMREMAFGQDAAFSDQAFLERYNADLANDLGNTVSRVAALCRQAFGSSPPEPCDDNELIGSWERARAAWRGAMDDSAFHRALARFHRWVRDTVRFAGAVEDPEGRGTLRPPFANPLRVGRRRSARRRAALAVHAVDLAQNLRRDRREG